MIGAQQLDALDPQTRQLVQSLLAQVQQRDAEIAFKQALIDKLAYSTPSRTPFHSDGGQHSAVMADTVPG